jgi:hypothetical protein
MKLGSHSTRRLNMTSKSKHQEQAYPHPGSGEPGKTSPGDFGVPESDVVERTYTSHNTKVSDPGAAQPRSNSSGTRTSGAGGNNSGPGSSSGGDIDTDIIGFGRGDNQGGIAASGKIHDPAGPDDATGTSRDFASGPPAAPNPRPASTGRINGSTVQAADERTVGPGGADAEANSDEGSDASAGEISSAEATGRDEAGD